MKKTYETPKVELLEFDYTDIVCTSGSSNLTDASTQWWKCETRIVDVHSTDNTVCGYL